MLQLIIEIFLAILLVFALYILQRLLFNKALNDVRRDREDRKNKK